MAAGSSRGKKQVTAKYHLKSFIMQNQAAVILLVGSVFAYFSTEGYFLAEQNIVSVLRQNGVTALLAMGFMIVLAGGGIDFSIGNMVNLLGGICVLATLKYPIFVVLPMVLGCGVLLGFVNGYLTVKLKTFSVLVTIAGGQVYRGFAFLITAGRVLPCMDQHIKNIGQYMLGGVLPVMIIIVAAVGIVFKVLMDRTWMGRYILAVGGNEKAAEASGIHSEKIKIITYMAAGFCTALGAIVLTGRTGVASPYAGDGFEISVLAAVALSGTSLSGGTAKVGGTILGCLTLGVFINYLNLKGVVPYWEEIVKGGMILAAMFLEMKSAAYYGQNVYGG